MVELQPDPVGVLEQQRIISRRPLVLARRADDFRIERNKEGMQFIDVGALAGAEAEVMEADAILLKRRALVFGDGARIATPVRPPTQ